MRNILFVAVGVALVGSCWGQGLFGGIVGGALRTAGNLLGPIVNENFGQDGYRFSYSTDDQVREERGEFVNGIWTVRGSVQWLSPDRTSKHMEVYVADDKGYKAEVMDEPFNPRAGLSPGALASLAG